MKPAFLIIALTCLFLQSEARLFRGNFLGDQDPDDIAGLPENEEHTHQGDTPHQRADSETVDSTAAVLQADIANGLRGDFQFIKNTLTQFADEDGFVREGIVFCGAEGLNLTIPTDYHSETGRLVTNDGYGNNVDVADDAAVCGSSNCEEGSFVALLSNRIRSLGYHVTHSDICQARSTNQENNVDVARTCKLGTNNLERKAYSDILDKDKECYQYTTAELCCGTGSSGERQTDTCTNSVGTECSWDAVEEICYSKPGTLNEEHTAIGADAATTKNAVRRVFSFGVGPVEVGPEDKVYVTGALAGSGGTSGCKSLRQYVAALNGMAQINAFRDNGIEETGDNWARVIKDARVSLVEYADILDDFFENSVALFPLIEYEELEECPMGDVNHVPGVDLGSVEAPTCERIDYDTADKLLATTSQLQTVLRSQCFCRNGVKVDDSVDSKIGDLAYLRISSGTCNKFAVGSSARTFCESPNLEASVWANVLENLQPLQKDVYVPPGRSSTLKATIANNVKKTLPPVADQAANCGRLVNSDEAASTSTTALFSNKGGNCVPFAKMNVLLRRLERESTGYNNTDSQDIVGLTFAGNTFASELYGDAISSALPDDEIEEAIFTSEVAQLAKRKIAGDNANLWAAIEEELTSTDEGRINQQIAHEAAEHFMRIVTTDEDDADVDSTDPDGERNGDPPTGLFVQLGEPVEFADANIGTIPSFGDAIKAVADADCDDAETYCNKAINTNFYIVYDVTRMYDNATNTLLTAAQTAALAQAQGLGDGSEAGYATAMLAFLNNAYGESQTDLTQYRGPYVDGASNYKLTMRADEWKLQYVNLDNMENIVILSGTRAGNILTGAPSSERGMIEFPVSLAGAAGYPVVTTSGQPAAAFSL